MIVSSEASQMIRETLIDMCRPFGTIESWRVRSADDDGLYRCSVKLQEAENREAIAEKLGAEWNGDELSVHIRLRQ